MITGLFVTSDMYDGGTELKEASEFNKKGYFEDEELVRQNIVLMKDQNVRECRPMNLFTYRHPMEVVMSLYKRNHNLVSRTGTNAWIEYNRLAIQALTDLCVVYSNYDNLLNNNVFESDRIMHEFHTKCGLSQSRTNDMTQTQFVDHSLRHHLQNTDLVGQCEMDDYGQAVYEERGMVDKNFNKRSFFIAMEMYCDMQSGVAFHSDYIWPDRHSVERK